MVSWDEHFNLILSAEHEANHANANISAIFSIIIKIYARYCFFFAVLKMRH